jgi:flavin-dependent dehydrogenase
MEFFDVVIVGAGPSGGEAARELAKMGYSVLLAEKSKDFTVNNYSSAGAPLSFMQKFKLPEQIVGASWNQIELFSNNNSHCWSSKEWGGVVMDFAKLKNHLADEAAESGAKVLLNCTYKSFDGTKVCFRLKDNPNYEVRTRVIIDATGGERSVLGGGEQAFPSTGLEHLVEVDEKTYTRWSQSLSVFMGSKWRPQGYGWIFPMEPNRLKVGIGRYFTNQVIVPREKRFSLYLDNLLEKCLNTQNLKILDTHGKTIYYTAGRKDFHFKDNCLAIGDAISMINPLAFEGIRHAMESSKVAACHVDRFLQGKQKTFSPYQRDIASYCGYKWRMCEFLMKKIYLEGNDKNIDLMIDCYKKFSFNEMMNLAFHYKFRESLKFYFNYLFKKGF